jgi:lycopene beta-cyclase
MPDSPYDYIIIGAGAAGLSLLSRMIDADLLRNKKLLLIEKSPKKLNDRTWCFWEKEPGYFEDIVYKKWDQLNFYDTGDAIPLNIAPYTYKMIRGIDFYEYCFAKAAAHPSVTIEYGEASFGVIEHGRRHIQLNGKTIQTDRSIVFNSIFNAPAATPNTYHLLQHFKGWIIKTPKPVFIPNKGTLMDFRIHQTPGASFVYVLPLSADSALVEYTLFTATLLEKKIYEEELKYYIENFLQINDYTIEEEEFGIIPMTNVKFPFFEQGVFNIGIAGGQTKSSTGYTFQFIQKQSSAIVACLLQGKDIQSISPGYGRFHFYDSVLLNLLDKGSPPCKEIFSRLFRKNEAAEVFKFLDNETALAEEIRIMKTLQFFPFLKAALQQIF